MPDGQLSISIRCSEGKTELKAWIRSHSPMSNISVIEVGKTDHGEYTELEENRLSQNNTTNKTLKNSYIFKKSIKGN